MECIFMFKRLLDIILDGTALINEEGEEIFKKKNIIAIDVMLVAFDKKNLPPSYQFLIHTLQNIDSAKKAWNLLREVYEKSPEEVQKIVRKTKNLKKKPKRKAKRENQVDYGKI